MGAIGNLIWFVCGGVFMGLGWWLAGLLALVTIVGIPWAKACFVIGQFAFFPFGKEAVNRKDLYQQYDIVTGYYFHHDSGGGEIQSVTVRFAGYFPPSYRCELCHHGCFSLHATKTFC